MSKWIGTCFLCGLRGNTMSKDIPLLDNCPRCNGMLSISFEEESSVLKRVEEGKVRLYHEQRQNRSAI